MVSLNEKFSPSVIPVIHRFETEVASAGFSLASSRLLTALNIQFNPIGQLPNSPEGQPIILLANHDLKLEPLLLAALMKREDIYFIGGMESLRLGQHIAERVLPIKPKRYASRKNSWLYGQGMNLAEITAMNQQSFETGANKLEAEGAVIGIFPTGGKGSIQNQWYKGIGYLIEKISLTKRQVIQILPVFFSGLEKIDLVKLAAEFLLTERIKQTRTVQVKFGKMKSIAEIIQNEINTSAITDLVKKFYLTELF